MQNLLSDAIKATPASFIRSILKTTTDPEIISFAGGLPNPISFPQEDLLLSMKDIVEKYKDRVFQYSITAGLPQLRQYIANRYNEKYDLGITEENVLITTGSQQALDLIGKTLLNKGDGVILEKPSYLGAIQAFSQYQPNFRPVELQEDGLNLEQLEIALNKENKLMYTVPNFQNPTGISYSKENREAVYELLKDKNMVIVEDDPYGELHFSGEQKPYIAARRYENSILLGSFSKTVTPGMRLGFLITKNKELYRYISVAKEAADLHSNIFAQYLLWNYLTNQDYDAHIQKIRNLYREQAEAMIAAIQKYFPKNTHYTIPEGGMFLWVTLPHNQDTLALFQKAIEKKVAFVPGIPFYTDEKTVSTMRLNYTNADTATIEEGIKRLGELLAISGR